ncbi:MAG: zinc ribbon domain-containing protein [Planctomycetes bacterium]|nr:zinc ribbon domain-containing protein [Planctomycetota bacterium]
MTHTIAPPKGMVTCPECAALNPGGLQFCNECGTVLPESHARPGSEAAARLRHEAGKDLDAAQRTLDRITLAYRLGAVAYGVATLLAILALGDATVPLGEGLVVVLLTTALTAALVMGALHVTLRPDRWTLVIAGLATLVTLVHLLGPNPFGLAAVGSGVWAVFTWALVRPTQRVAALIDKHLDQYVLHHASSATRRTLAHRNAKERHERLMDVLDDAEARADRRSIVAAAVLIVVALLGSVLVAKFLRTAPLSFAQQSFEAAWNGGDAGALEALLDERVSAAEAPRLRRLLLGHGWSATRPALPTGVLREGDDTTWIDYDLGKLTLTASFVRADRGWSLVGVELPTPPIEATLERFRAAWATSDPRLLSEFFPAASRSEWVDRLRKSMETREWSALPGLFDVRVTPGDPGRASVLLVLQGDAGEVETSWVFDDEGDWRLYGFKLPKR